MRAVLIPSLCLACAVVIAAEEGMTVRVRLAADWRQQLASLRPFDLIGDERATAVRERVVPSLTLLAREDSDLVPIWEALLNMGACAYFGDSPFIGNRDPGWALLVDVGESAERLTDWTSDNLMFDEDSALGEFIGGSSVFGGFLGWRKSHLVMGDDVLCADLVAEGLPAAGTRLAHLSADLAGQVTMLRRWRAVEPRISVLDEVFTGWESARPRVEVNLRKEQGRLSGSIDGIGFGSSTLATFDAGLAGLARADRPAVAGIALPPTVWWRILLELWPEVADGWAVPGGVWTGEDLADVITGDVMVQADWRVGPFPTGAVVIGLHPGPEVTQAAQHQCARLAWAGDATSGWTFSSPLGEWQAQVVDGRLVLGNDPALVEAWIAGTPGGRPCPEGVTAWLDVDLPSLVAHWYPTLVLWVTTEGADIGQDPLVAFNLLAWAVAETFGQVQPPKDLTGVLEMDAEMGGWLWEAEWAWERIFPGGNPTEILDTSVAVYQKQADPEHPNQSNCQVVVRFAEGWWVTDGEEPVEALAAAALAERLEGCEQVYGIDPATLPILDKPLAIAVEPTWFPAAETVAAHCDPWRVRIHPDMGGIRIIEEGVPAITLLAGLGTLTAWSTQVEWAGMIEEAVEQDTWEPADPEVTVALERLAAAVRRHRRTGLPDRASGLIDDDLRLGELQPLFSTALTVKEDLDTCAWMPTVSRRGNAVLSLPMSGIQSALVVEITLGGDIRPGKPTIP